MPARNRTFPFRLPARSAPLLGCAWIRRTAAAAACAPPPACVTCMCIPGKTGTARACCALAVPHIAHVLCYDGATSFRGVQRGRLAPANFLHVHCAVWKRASSRKCQRFAVLSGSPWWLCKQTCKRGCSPCTKLMGCHSRVQRRHRQLGEARLAIQVPAQMQYWPAQWVSILLTLSCGQNLVQLHHEVGLPLHGHHFKRLLLAVKTTPIDPHRLHSLRLANACAEGNMYEPSSASAPARLAASGAAKSVAELCERSTKLLQRPVAGKKTEIPVSTCSRKPVMQEHQDNKCKLGAILPDFAEQMQRWPHTALQSTVTSSCSTASCSIISERRSSKQDRDFTRG